MCEWALPLALKNAYNFTLFGQGFWNVFLHVFLTRHMMSTRDFLERQLKNEEKTPTWTIFTPSFLCSPICTRSLTKKSRKDTSSHKKLEIYWFHDFLARHRTPNAQFGDASCSKGPGTSRNTERIRNRNSKYVKQTGCQWSSYLI